MVQRSSLQVESRSRAAFQSLVGLLSEISAEWVGPARGIGDIESDNSDAGSIIVRFYYQDERPAAADPATAPVLSIERERDGDAPTPAASDAEIAKRLERVANWVRSKYER